MSKLYRAHSLMYRRQILQENIRWKALDAIYKIYMLLHRSDFDISEKIVKPFRILRQILQRISIFEKKYEEFSQKVAEVLKSERCRSM